MITRFAVFVGFLLSASIGLAQNDSRLLTATTVAVVAEVEYLRVDKSKYDNQAEVNRILRIVDDAGLFKTPAFPRAPYRVTAAEKADIIVTIVESVALPQTVSLTVRDADTNDQLFEERRDLVELRNDIKRLIKHFLASVDDKRAEMERAEEVARRQEREAQAAAEVARASQRCRDEEKTFRQNIISAVFVQHGSVPLVTPDIANHNQRCPSYRIVPEEVVKDHTAELATVQAAEQARAEEGRREQEKKVVLSAWQREIASASFVIPTTGPMTMSYQLPAPRGLYYIIPSDGKSDKCTFPPLESKRLKKSKSFVYVGVVDCARIGREDFFVVNANDRFYLVKAITAIRSTAGQIGIVKDNGTTICFHEEGCQHILAEIRLAPTDLPHGIQVPPPAPLTGTYTADGLSFRHPSNWVVSSVNGGSMTAIAPPEGRIGEWVAVGVFVMHLSPNVSFPTTATGAIERLISHYQKQGRVFPSSIASATVAGYEGVESAYSASSPISGEEKGHLIVIPDGENGYYAFWTFSPASETETYRAVLKSILDTVQLDRNLYSTDLYSGTVHNLTVNKASTIEARIRNEGGKIAGCVGIVEPLYGSGPIQGEMKGGLVTFAAHLNGFEIQFRAQSENGKITGTYTVEPTNATGTPMQKGEFTLNKTGLQPLLVRPCPTDAEMNARNR